MHTVTKHTRQFVQRALLASLAVAGLVTGSASHAAVANGTATGTVIQPIAITSFANLNFGTFASGAGGTITVSTSGARTATGVVPIGTTSAAGRFDITGTPASTYSITHGGTAVLTNTTGGGNETMTLTKFSDLTGANATSGNVANGTLDGAGAQSLFIGGSLTVAANQVAGVYTGTVIATVEYN